MYQRDNSELKAKKEREKGGRGERVVCREVHVVVFPQFTLWQLGPHFSDPFIHLQCRVPQPVLHLHPLVRYSTVLWTCCRFSSESHTT